MIVVDLGCAGFREDHSIPLLVERFHPNALYGFDPYMGDERFSYDTTEVLIRRAAAWLYNGSVEMGIGAASPLDITNVRDKNDRSEWSNSEMVPCFDFSHWLRVLGSRVVLKMNIEGAEFDLLDRMHRDGTDCLVDLLLVMWHDSRMGGEYPQRRSWLEVNLHCPIEEWTNLPSSSPTFGDHGKTG